MGRDPAEPGTPDLFSTDTVRDPSSPPPKPSAATATNETVPQRHILPKNLSHAVTQLSDGELDELFEVVFDEAKREADCRGVLEPTRRHPLVAPT